MNKAAMNFLKCEGEIDRGLYALIGFAGFALKHNLDRLVASLFFNRPWSIFNYWIPPETVLSITSMPRHDAVFFVALLATALPFTWIGVVLTVMRLRAIGLPVWSAVMFFAPVANLLFFLLLCVLPSRPRVGSPSEERTNGGFLERLIPRDVLGSAAFAILLIVPLGAAAVYLGTVFFRSYGWSVFVALPFCLGLGAVLIYAYHSPRSVSTCMAVAVLSVVLLGATLLMVALEGVICLIMALPIALPLAMLGGLLGYLIQRRPIVMRTAPSTLAVVVFFVPGMMSLESIAGPRDPVLVVRTAVDINAATEKVWREVVAFTEIPEPPEAIFRLGIAYPRRATITLRGPGAIRRCEFSTGSFIEPIEIWDEPRLLSFGVTANPAPMQEWTPYKAIHPPHLDGFLVSKHGQFLLTRLPSGGTHLEGTTWYQHHMWPAMYWQLWSNAVIHRIHLRVLRHIKERAEEQPRCSLEVSPSYPNGPGPRIQER